MDKVELLRLAERVEALSGRSRELDAEITVAVSAWPDARIIWHKGLRRYYGKAEGRTPFAVAGGRGTDWGIAFQEVNYTASLDAAMTLVPEGCGWSLVQATYEKSYGCIESGDDRTPDLEARAATPALVLCAAALRALAKEE